MGLRADSFECDVTRLRPLLDGGEAWGTCRLGWPLLPGGHITLPPPLSPHGRQAAGEWTEGAR